jgi:hypothetical protein
MPPRDAEAYLQDAIRSAQDIVADTAELNLQAYLDQRSLRRACERNFQIIGEALRRIDEVEPGLLDCAGHVKRTGLYLPEQQSDSGGLFVKGKRLLMFEELRCFA